jgi:hypothetical protein
MIRRHRALSYAMAVVMALSFFCVAGLGAYAVIRGNDARQENCLQIEELKAAEREEAIERYDDLGQTLRLLGVQRTDEIDTVARERRDETLKRFEAREC